MEIKNKVTVTRGEGIMEENRGKDKWRNIYRGPMGMENEVGIDCGSRVELGGRGEQQGKIWDNYIEQ